ncbi:hypothetical protein AERO9AM_10223 [Aeromicrobium sp. 9AM]|nr:hypothetical protein AERO9AM_10223 [Aeromicrobium sp. 9AM]
MTGVGGSARSDWWARPRPSRSRATVRAGPLASSPTGSASDVSALTRSLGRPLAADRERALRAKGREVADPLEPFVVRPFGRSFLAPSRDSQSSSLGDGPFLTFRR